MPETELPEDQPGVRAMQCYRLQDGRFHVVREGRASVLIAGGDHILVREPLASILRELCGHCLELVPAVVMQVVSRESWPGYFEVLPQEQIDPDTVSAADPSGYMVWGFGRGCLFVSPAVRREILQRGIDELHFSKGFSRFAGAA